MRRSIWWAVLFTVVALSAASLVTHAKRGSTTETFAQLGGATARLARGAAGATSVAAASVGGAARAAKLDVAASELVRRASAALAVMPAAQVRGAGGVVLGAVAGLLALLAAIVAFVGRRRSSRRVPYHAALRMIRRGTPEARIGRRTRLAQDAVRLIGRRA